MKTALDRLLTLDTLRRNAQRATRAADRKHYEAKIKQIERDYVLAVGNRFSPFPAYTTAAEHEAGRWAVYFLLAPRAKRVKIGCTRSVVNRIGQLQQGAPEKLYLIGWLPGGYAVERSLHEKIAGSRAYGEWFDITPETLALLAIHDMDPLLV